MIPAVILAAGKSTRMGSPKALLSVDGETFLARIIGTLRDANVDDIVVVVGHDAEMIGAAVGQVDAAARVVVNPAYESGQLSSILAGVREIDRPGVDAMLFTLVDVPLVSAATVRAVIARYREKRPMIVRPVDRDRHGHPVIIDRALFAALRAADPATGAKSIVRGNVSRVGDVLVLDEGAFADIDTPEDYHRLIERRRSLPD